MRRPVIVTYQGEEMTLERAVALSGTAINYETVRYRVTHGWALARALHIPAGPTGKRGGAMLSLRPAREWGSL